MTVADPAIRAAAWELRLATSATAEGVEWHGRSMEPFFREGDGVGIKPVAWDDIAVGDIITYRLEDKFPTYRVVKKRPHKLILAADHWPGRIFRVWPEDVVGRAESRLRDGRRIDRRSPEWRLTARRVQLRNLARTALHRARRRAGDVRRRGEAARALRTTGLSEIPDSLQIGISNPCNLACRMCPYLEVHDSDRGLMTLETFERFVPILPYLGNVHLSGFGETLLNKNILAFVDRIREVNPKITIAVTNNGTLLREPIARGLIEHGVDRIIVSLDGATAETVESIRLGVNFAEVIENVRRLAEIKRELGRTKPVIRFNYMVGYGTYRELPELVRLAKRVGVGELRLLEMQPATEADTVDNLLNNLERDGGESLREAVKLADHYAIHVELPTTNEGRCLHPQTPHISADGEVFPCCYLAYDRTLFSQGREVKLPSMSFGNAQSEDFFRIWDREEYRAFRRQNRDGQFSEACKACYETRIPTSRRLAERF